MERPEHWPDEADDVELAPRLWTPREVFSARKLTDVLHIGLRLRLNDQHQYDVTDIQLSASGYATITGSLLRQVKLAQETMLIAQVFPCLKSDKGYVPAALAFHELDYTKHPESDQEKFERVAQIFAFYNAIGGNPAAEVAETMGLARSTADYWIRRAKDKGFIYAAS